MKEIKHGTAKLKWTTKGRGIPVEVSHKIVVSDIFRGMGSRVSEDEEDCI